MKDPRTNAISCFLIETLPTAQSMLKMVIFEHKHFNVYVTL